MNTKPTTSDSLDRETEVNGFTYREVALALELARRMYDGTIAGLHRVGKGEFEIEVAILAGPSVGAGCRTHYLPLMMLESLVEWNDPVVLQAAGLPVEPAYISDYENLGWEKILEVVDRFIDRRDLLSVGVAG